MRDLTPSLLLAECQRRGLAVRLDNGNVKLDGPKRAMTPDLIDAIRGAKQELVRHLSWATSDQNWATNTGDWATWATRKKLVAHNSAETQPLTPQYSTNTNPLEKSQLGHLGHKIPGESLGRKGEIFRDEVDSTEFISLTEGVTLLGFSGPSGPNQQNLFQAKGIDEGHTKTDCGPNGPIGGISGPQVAQSLTSGVIGERIGAMSPPARDWFLRISFGAKRRGQEDLEADRWAYEQTLRANLE